MFRWRSAVLCSTILVGTTAGLAGGVSAQAARDRITNAQATQLFRAVIHNPWIVTFYQDGIGQTVSLDLPEVRASCVPMQNVGPYRNWDTCSLIANQPSHNFCGYAYGRVTLATGDVWVIQQHILEATSPGYGPMGACHLPAPLQPPS